MRKMIFVVLLAMVFGFAFVGCNNDDCKKDEKSVVPDFVAEDISLTKGGLFELNNASRYMRAEARQAGYLHSDDTGWCGGGFKYNVAEDVLAVDFSEINEIEPGVVRFNFKDFLAGSGFDWLALDRLPEKDRRMFVRKTSIASTYGADDLVLAVLLDDGEYSPVPTMTQSYGRSKINWPIVSRNHERSDCIIIMPSDPVIPDPITPDPITPDPITPDPITPDPVIPDPTCVNVAINTANKEAIFHNIYAGFGSVGIGPVVAVSEKTGWRWEDGVPVTVTNGNGKVDLARLMFATGTTRFNFIMRLAGVEYWFVTVFLCDESRGMLEHETNAPEAPWAHRDVVMALEDITEPFTGWYVGYRG